jgi:hypothetical protein
MTRHIGERALARFRQGDLSARRSARIRAHLAGCARCTDLNDDLTAVTTLLAHVQTPPIPEYLSARIQTALAAESARRAALTTVAGNAAAQTAGAATPDAPTSRHVARSPLHEGPAHGRRQPRAFRLSSPVALRAMAAAAVVVVVGGGFYEVATHVGGSAASHSGPEFGSSGSAATSPPVAGVNTPAGPVAAPQLHYEYGGRQGSVTAVESGTNYGPATLSSQVSQELRGNPAKATGRAGNSEHSIGTFGSGATFGGILVSRLQGCVSRLATHQQVLLVDVARYQGTLATVIVTRASPGGPEQVWVVGSGCSSARSDVFTHVTLAAAG